MLRQNETACPGKQCGQWPLAQCDVKYHDNHARQGLKQGRQERNHRVFVISLTMPPVVSASCEVRRHSTIVEFSWLWIECESNNDFEVEAVVKLFKGIELVSVWTDDTE